MRGKIEMPQNKFKKYCLLANGQIKPCYYPNGDLRWFDRENGQWFLNYDEYANNTFITHHVKVVKFADTFEELQKEKKKW